MKYFRFIFALTAFFFINFDQSAFAKDPLNVKEFTLDNGLKVYLTENHEKPVFYAEIIIRAGSKHDPADATGIAHYLEHMLFKGTKKLGTTDYKKEKVHLDKITALYETYFQTKDSQKRSKIYNEINKESHAAAKYAVANEFDSLYSSLGQRGLNAHTYYEETVYKVTLPANRMEQWAQVESERFLEPVFRLFNTEIEAVYEEKNRAADNPGRLLRSTLNKAMYKKHPYGAQPVIGTIEHLKNPSLKKMYEFYRTYYVPNNMAIVISGDIDTKKTIETIKKYFIKWKKHPLPKIPTWQEKPIQKPIEVSVNFPGQEMLVMAFRTVKIGESDQYALQMMDMIMDNSQAGLININLNQKLKVLQAGSYPQFLNDYGTQSFYGMPKKNQTLEEVKDLILAQIEEIKKGHFEDWLLDAVLTDFSKSKKRNYESNKSRVSMIRKTFLAFQPWTFEVNELRELRKVTKADIIRVAKKYFSRGYVVAYRRNHKRASAQKVSKPKFKPIAMNTTAHSQFYNTILGIKFPNIEPVYVDFKKDFKKTNLRDGIELYYKKNPVNDLFQISFIFPKGENHDKTLVMAANLMNKSGTKEMSTTQLQLELYKLGSSYHVSIGGNKSVLVIEGLDKNLKATFQLLLPFFRHYIAEQKTLNTLVEMQIGQREKSKKNPKTIFNALVNFSRYGKKSPYLDTLTNKQLKQLKAKDLKENLGKLFQIEHKINYVGSYSFVQIKTLLSDLWTKKPTIKPFEKKYFIVQKYKEKTINFVESNLVQTNIRMEFRGDLYNPEIRQEFFLFNSLFGQHVYQEVREARALAYSAWARFSTGSSQKEFNLFRAGIGCQADKTIEAVKLIDKLVYSLPDNKAKFKIAKDAIESRYRISRMNYKSILSSIQNWEESGFINIDPRKQSFERVQKMNFKEIKLFVKKRIFGKNAIFSISGKSQLIQLDKFKDFAKLNVIKSESLFGY